MMSIIAKDDIVLKGGIKKYNIKIDTKVPFFW